MKIGMMRSHNFNFGHQPVNFESTTKQNFLDFSKCKNVQTKMSESTKNDLIKHHFDLGNQTGMMMSTTQREFANKTQVERQSPQIAKHDFQKTNINFGNQPSPKVSSTNATYQGA